MVRPVDSDSMGDGAAPDLEATLRRVRALVDRTRSQCLWYLREDYYPATRDEALRVLSAIERHGDLAAFREAGELRRWLSPRSNSRSAG